MALSKEDLLAIREVVDESVSGLKEDVGILKTEMKEVKADITKIQVNQLENYLIPLVNELNEYQKSTYSRYNETADKFENKIIIYDAMSDTVKTHTKQIQELQQNQA